MTQCACLAARYLAVSLVAFAVPPSSFGEAPLVVATLSTDRSHQCGAIDFTFLSGQFFTTVRTALQTESNFGPSGIVAREIVFSPEMATITRGGLNGVDILFITPLASALTECEIDAIAEFASMGGGVFAFENDAATQLAEVVGATAGGEGSGSGSVISGSIMASGPFGSVSGVFPWSYHLTFSSVGPNGQACIQSDGVIAAAFTQGAGRLVIVNDEEWCGDQDLQGCAASWLPNAALLKLFLNSVAWIAPPPWFEFTLSDSIGDLDGNGLVNGSDLGSLLGQWGSCSGCCAADLNGDGIVDGDDLGTLLGAWGPIP